jgi:hypothetical protein
MIRHNRGALALLLLLSACLTAAPPVAAQARLARILIWEQSLLGTDKEGVRWPVAVAAASSEEVAVADAHGSRLLIFRKAGVSWQLARSLSLPEAPVAVAHDGHRYVVSLRGKGGLVALEGEQMLQRKIGVPGGIVPGALAALSDGAIFVHDFARGRVLQLSPEGALARDIRVEGHVTALAATPGGSVYVALGDEAAVLRYDASGRQDARWEIPGEGPVPAWPSGLAVEPGGDVAVVDRHGYRILVYDASGTAVGVGSRKGWEPGLLMFPGGIARLPDGRLLVADQGNGRVQIFRRADRGPDQ